MDPFLEEILKDLQLVKIVLLLIADGLKKTEKLCPT